MNISSYCAIFTLIFVLCLELSPEPLSPSWAKHRIFRKQMSIIQTHCFQCISLQCGGGGVYLSLWRYHLEQITWTTHDTTTFNHLRTRAFQNKVSAECKTLHDKQTLFLFWTWGPEEMIFKRCAIQSESCGWNRLLLQTKQRGESHRGVEAPVSMLEPMASWRAKNTYSSPGCRHSRGICVIRHGQIFLYVTGKKGTGKGGPLAFLGNATQLGIYLSPAFMPLSTRRKLGDLFSYLQLSCNSIPTIKMAPRYHRLWDRLNNEKQMGKFVKRGLQWRNEGTPNDSNLNWSEWNRVMSQQEPLEKKANVRTSCFKQCNWASSRPREVGGLTTWSAEATNLRVACVMDVAVAVAVGVPDGDCWDLVSRYVPLMMASSMSCRFFRSSSPSGCNVVLQRRKNNVAMLVKLRISCYMFYLLLQQNRHLRAAVISLLSLNVPLIIANSMSCIFFKSSSPSGWNIHILLINHTSVKMANHLKSTYRFFMALSATPHLVFTTDYI